jgi:hypothetical protein
VSTGNHQVEGVHTIREDSHILIVPDGASMHTPGRYPFGSMRPIDEAMIFDV